MSTSESMDDRVHARLVAVALDHGLSPDEALRYADLRKKSIEASGIGLSLALDNLRRALAPAAEAAAARIARVMQATTGRRP